METKAHHVLIGAFTLVVIAAAVVFALWLARTSVNRQYHYYDIVFMESVTGLSKGGAVQYNGIQVGEVSQLKLDPRDPRKVIARIRVASDTPVKTDTRAKLGLLGLTGVAFIQLTGGKPGSAPLLPTPDDPVPQIPSESSALSQLLNSGADIVTTLNGILAKADSLLSQENIDRINRTLAHLDQTMGAVADERDDIRTLLQQATAASKELNETLHSTNALVNNQGKATLDSARAALASLQHTSETLDKLLAENRGSLQSGLEGVSQLGPALRELRGTLRDIRGLTQKLQGNPAGYLLGRDRPQEFDPGKQK
ncbi:MAG TPA: MlaD family protein [Rhodanobacteraceae bacterium]|nr:MlaD family protein [Rhodanobacteraceae bacterium]